MNTVTVTGGPDGSWSLTIRTDFSARMLEEFGSGSVVRILRAAESITEAADLGGATSVMDAVPFEEAVKIVDAALGAAREAPKA